MTEEFTKDQRDILENEVQYISYKRTIQYNGDYISHEMSMNVNPEVGLTMTEKYLRKRLHWLLTQTMKNIDSRWDEVTNYIKNKD